MFKRLKYVVVAVAVELDENDAIIGESSTQPQQLYGEAEVVEFVRAFERDVKSQNA